MVREISPLQGPHLQRGAELPGAGKPQGPSFADVLKESLEQVNALQAQKTEKIQDLVTGKANSVEEVMVAVEEANLAFEFTMQVRNKLVEAYNELLRMQV
jgi:flagellar hook-basal body complex protein FliE